MRERERGHRETAGRDEGEKRERKKVETGARHEREKEISHDPSDERRRKERQDKKR